MTPPEDVLATTLTADRPHTGKLVPSGEMDYARKMLRRVHPQIDRMYASVHWPECNDDLRGILEALDRIGAAVEAQIVANQIHRRTQPDDA